MIRTIFLLLTLLSLPMPPAAVVTAASVRDTAVAVAASVFPDAATPAVTPSVAPEDALPTEVTEGVASLFRDGRGGGQEEADTTDDADGYELIEPVGSSSFSGDASDAAALLRGEDRTALTAPFAKLLENPAADDYARMVLRLAAGYSVYGKLSFTACPEVPMMADGQVLPLYCKFNLHGDVTADAPITSVTVTITHEKTSRGLYPYVKTVTFDPADNITCYDINEPNTKEKNSLNNLTHTESLRPGGHTLSITATTTEQTEPVELVHVRFTLERMRWIPLTRNSFADNYSTVLNFFGGNPKKFLFSFRWRQSGDRKIMVDPIWRSTYLTKCRWGNVHVDAAPYFHKAENYVDTVYVNVNCGKRSSGVIPLKDLISKNDGTTVMRFMSNRKYISHHTLGTVVDLNADMAVNSQRKKNKQLIYNEVKNYLVYNGIQTDKTGRQYYDFTYTGAYRRRLHQVPCSVVNYLLYELAFYRADFRWGFYFGEYSDAMHFTLTETQYELFDHGAYALRKVFDYIPSDGIVAKQASPAPAASPYGGEPASHPPASSASPVAVFTSPATASASSAPD